MNNSIPHFFKEGIKNINDYENDFLKDPTDIASFVYGIRKEIYKLAQDIFAETLEMIDETIRNDTHRLEHWHIVRKDEESKRHKLINPYYFRDLYDGQRNLLRKMISIMGRNI